MTKRRTFLQSGATAGTALLPAGAAAQNQSGAPVVKRIPAVSHGALGRPDANLSLLRYLIGLTGKKNPSICLLPTATGDAVTTIALFLETLSNLECRPRIQRTYISSRSLGSFETLLLGSDAIFVSGGNTLNMLAIWKAQGIDRILRTAWERGIVLAGESAGSICWFEQGSTDSRPGSITAMDCLGFLKGSNCPHYDAEKERRPIYHRMVASGEIAPGIAIDEGVALLYEDMRLARIVSARQSAWAWSVKAEDGKAVEERLTPEYIGV